MLELLKEERRKGELMLIVILLGVIGLLGLGFSIFLFRKYKENHKINIFIFFIILLVLSLDLILTAVKWVG